MSVRGHIVSLFVATGIAWISWLLVLTNINPTQSTWWGFALFYVSLFLSLFGSLTILGFVFRTVLPFRRMTLNYKLTSSLRQAFLWSLALISALALQGVRLLSWWIFILLVVIFALAEFFITSLKNRSANA